MLNLHDGRTPNEATVRVKQLEAVRFLFHQRHISSFIFHKQSFSSQLDQSLKL